MSWLKDVLWVGMWIESLIKGGVFMSSVMCVCVLSCVTVLGCKCCLLCVARVLCRVVSVISCCAAF